MSNEAKHLTGYNFIGGIHDHVDERKFLLENLDYVYNGNACHHSFKQKVFLGILLTEDLNSGT